MLTRDSTKAQLYLFSISRMAKALLDVHVSINAFSRDALSVSLHESIVSVIYYRFFSKLNGCLIFADVVNFEIRHVTIGSRRKED
jgi:hypothetical protein